ncbi:ABC transporter substrate-binding protein [Streptomyces phaeolivaceus]|uniref:ABC transporter substrate-binding protein n=1 Tax=Streptomyces phaeolivaceus TaxID=2653200 RepID=UPI00186A5EDC|nr:ABC transporter substrate-binding protein [Streptomyces phaeolivaceus]
MTIRRMYQGACAVIVAAASLVGCSESNGKASGGGGSGSPDGLTTTNVFGKAAGDLDTLKWDVPDGEPTSLSPIFAANFSGQAILANLCDQLLVQDADYKISPHLAKATQVNDTTVTLDVVEKAKFWDGKPVTAEDVVFSLKQQMRPDAQFGFAFKSVSSISETGARQVTVKFKKPDELFVKELASPIGMVWQKDYAEAKGAAYGTAGGGLMCSGPFELGKWNQGRSMTLTRNDAYWNPTYRAHAKQVELSFVTDTAALTQGLLAGEFDGAWNVRPSQVDALKGGDKGSLVVGDSLAQTMVSFANAGGVTGNPDLRRAILGSIDREAIGEKVFKGTADPSYTVVAPNYWDEGATAVYEKAYGPYEKSNKLTVEQAKKLVESSGYKGQTLKLAYPSGDATQSLLSQIIQEQLAGIGVKVKIISMEPLAFLTATYTPSQRRSLDLMMMGNYGYAKDPLEFITFFLGPDETYNWTDFSDPEVTAGLTEARATFDAEKRAEILVRLQEKWEAAAPFASFLMPKELTYVKNGIGGVVTSGAYLNLPSLALIGTK